MILNNDSFGLIYELLCNFSVENAEVLTEYELDCLKHIRHDFNRLHNRIIER